VVSRNAKVGLELGGLYKDNLVINNNNTSPINFTIIFIIYCDEKILINKINIIFILHQ
jgi:hypothetical protein